ncbi:MAG: hypothetical protein ACO398_09870, partial [Kiritimatiellia bacterium]
MVGMLLRCMLMVAGCWFYFLPVPGFAETLMAGQGGGVSSPGLPADLNLPGVLSYRGAGIFRWPGSVSPHDLPRAYGEAVPDKVLSGLKDVAVDWCRRNGQEDTRRMAALAVGDLRFRPPKPDLFWPVPAGENNPLIHHNQDWDFLLLHPQSPRRGDAELLKQALDDLAAWAEKPVDRDQSRAILLKYLRLKRTIPQLVPSTPAARFEQQIRDYCDKIAPGEEGGMAASFSEDVMGHLKPNHALKSATLQHLAGLILDDTNLIHRPARVMDSCFKNLQPDGAVRYVPCDVPDTFYLVYNTNQLLEYWLVSGNPQAHAMLVTMAARIPLYYLPLHKGAAGDMPFRIAGGNQGNYWH